MKNNLKSLRITKGLTQEGLANLVGVQKGYISRLEAGKIGLTEEWIKKLCPALNCTPNELLSLPGERLVKLVGYVGAGAEIFPVDTSGDEMIDEVDAPPGVDADSVVAVKVRGESMYPAYREGDILYYHRHCNYDESTLRRECVVKVKNGAVYIKVLTRGSKPETFTLNSYNSPPIEDVQIDWACKILWVKKSQ